MEQYNDLFINTPESLERYLKAKTVISILGGTKLEKEAEVMGHDVAESGYSIRTGGYAMGAMKGGLVGGSDGLPTEKSEFEQKIEGVTSADFKPVELATKGENISTTIANDPYERLRSLIRGSDILVVAEGSIGTELEIYASFAFEIELEILNSGKSEKPIIFVGEKIKEKILTVPKFAEYLSKSENIIFVNNPEDVIDNVNLLFEKIKDEKRKEFDM
jgi:predicted Rossmann-fold nucleotide-binding protein